MKINLLFPPNDDKYENLRTGYISYPPPTHLNLLSSFIQKHIDDISITLFDGNITSLSKMIENIDCDWLGISDWFTNHENAMTIAKLAKAKNHNIKIVIGGPNASNLTCPPNIGPV